MIRVSLRIAILAIAASSAVCAASVSNLLQQADAVVIGTQSAAVQMGRVVGFQLSVERVFKGTLAPASVVAVAWDSGTDQKLWSTPPALRGLWFLKAGPQGWKPIELRFNPSHSPADLVFATSAGPLPPALAYSDETPVAEKLILEIGAGAQADPTVILDASWDVNSANILNLFRYLSQANSPPLRQVGMAGLIARGDVGGLLQLEREYGSLDGGAASGTAISDVGVKFRNTDPAAVAVLGRLATTDATPRLKRYAAMALQAMHTNASLPYLAALLDSPDPGLQQYAVQGLGFFANGVGVQTPATMPGLDHLNHRQPTPYRTKETEAYLGFDRKRAAEFVNFWRTWWNAHPELHATQ